ncbi:hypothetical protein MNEG_2154 [Monoraphidium neglectum]|uniref:Pseudouridine synthase I TruA alpha/beta domain-containing protein n=1 Tax=Monoraphidium neglectum TaxID=145388 RepID=A0A0D2MT95_9CHLO|nr:hypothetical protein MNEG_2154 [Monoraphidium neglectum]KIZ05800.1 hypothetical protein MNEG_2154 [Monoraphidium neglectum]|eukprot:XP_013904819.1 hypothetical protein MNEG_2154 [Monoraphidium neglectum]
MAPRSTAAAVAAAPAADPDVAARVSVCKQLRDLLAALECAADTEWPPAEVSGQLRAIAGQLEAQQQGQQQREAGALATPCASGTTATASHEVIEQLERSYQATTSAATAAPAAAPPAQPQTKRRRRAAGTAAAAAKPLDFSRYRQRYVALHLMYLGGKYHGLARQPDTENTIEARDALEGPFGAGGHGVFFAALRHVRLIPPEAEPSSLQYSRCGRTDRGVSALGQVLAIKLRSAARADEPPLPADEETDFAAIINRALPSDIRVLGWADVSDGFSARFDARTREYKYFIVQDGSLDLAAMREAAGALVGEHDFRNFCRADVLQVRNFRRSILSASIDRVPAAAGDCQVYALCIRGTAFLWHQVRCIAALLLMVGRGLEAPSIVATLLDVTRVPAKPQYNYAPEEPLMLYACEFEGIQWVRRPRALARACEDVRGHMDRHLVAAAMCGAMLDTLLPQLGEPPQQGQQQAAAAADGGGGDGGGGGGGGGGWGAGGPAAAAAAAGHQPRRPVMASAKTKLSQGELAQQCLVRAPAPVIDIGVNLADDAFDKDRAEVLSRAAAAGVAAIIVTGCSVRSAAAAAALCDGASPVPLFFTAGVHPHNAKECDASTLDELRRLARHPKCVAIGECGLDFNRNFSPPDVQVEWFEKQVALALELNKPLFMHCRDAGEKFAEILRAADPAAAAREGGVDGDGDGASADGQRQPAVAGVLHCFTGNEQELRDCLGLGLCIGITGWVCDDRPERGGAELAALLRDIPDGRLMIETDAPYLVPRTIKPSKARPHRNEPSLLPHVLAQVAASLGRGEAEVAEATSRAAAQFFGLPAEVLAAQRGS